MFLEYELVSEKLDVPQVYIATNTREMVDIYYYKTKIVVNIWNNKLDEVSPDESGKRPMTRKTFKIDKKNKFFEVLRWIETQVCMEVIL